jgi:hypothetical protein
MKMRIVFALALAGAAGMAKADTVDLSYTGTGNGRVVTVKLGAQTWDAFAGRLNFSTANGTGQLASMPSSVVMFCAELLQGQSGSSNQFAKSSIATLSSNGGATNLGFARQQAIYDLYAAAAGRQFTLGHDYAVAFQISLWEVIYDYNPAATGGQLDVNGGTFRAYTQGGAALSTSITEKVSFLLGSIGMNAAANGLMGFKNGGFQDELWVSDGLVPLPTGAWLGLAGLGVAAFIRSRRR